MLMRLFLAQLDKRYGPMVFLCLLDSLGPFKSEPSLAVLVYFASYRATPEDWSCLPHQTLAVAPIPCEVILHPVTNEQYDGSGEDGDTGASAGMPRLLATGHGIVPSKAAIAPPYSVPLCRAHPSPMVMAAVASRPHQSPASSLLSGERIARCPHGMRLYEPVPSSRPTLFRASSICIGSPHSSDPMPSQLSLLWIRLGTEAIQLSPSC
jgi:hypothetical protein